MALQSRSKVAPVHKSTKSEALPWKTAATRAIASSGTWLITEYPKLILQQQRRHHFNHPLLATLDVYKATPFRDHLRGAVSSSCQSGSLALIMFYGQRYISHIMIQTNSTESTWNSSGMAGFLGGGVSSLVHTIFEPMKIRHERISQPLYSASLWPMMWRHALFDGTFVATSTYLKTHYDHVSYATQFESLHSRLPQ